MSRVDLSRASDPHVWHFVMTRAGRDVERLETMAIEPEQLAQLVAQLGKHGVRNAIEATRLKWQRAVLKQMGEGHAVRVVRERGYIRSLFPGAAVPPPASGPSSIITGHGGIQ